MWIWLECDLNNSQPCLHRALLLDEIIDPIFSHFMLPESIIPRLDDIEFHRQKFWNLSDANAVARKGDVRLAQTTCLSLALSCRRFLEPALNALWCVLLDVNVLWRLVPLKIAPDLHLPVRSSISFVDATTNMQSHRWCCQCQTRTPGSASGFTLDVCDIFKSRAVARYIQSYNNSMR